MDATSDQGGDNERDSRRPYTRPELQPLGTRQQSRNPVLGGKHYHYDVTDRQHNPAYYPINNDYKPEFHHHHGPGVNDILIHDHKHALGIHNHLIDGRDIYGADDHKHDEATSVAGDGQRPATHWTDRVYVDGVGWCDPLPTQDG